MFDRDLPVFAIIRCSILRNIKRYEGNALFVPKSRSLSRDISNDVISTVILRDSNWIKPALSLIFLPLRRTEWVYFFFRLFKINLWLYLDPSHRLISIFDNTAHKTISAWQNTFWPLNVRVWRFSFETQTSCLPKTRGRPSTAGF